MVSGTSQRMLHKACAPGKSGNWYAYLCNRQLVLINPTRQLCRHAAQLGKPSAHLRDGATHPAGGGSRFLPR